MKKQKWLETAGEPEAVFCFQMILIYLIGNMQPVIQFQ